MDNNDSIKSQTGGLKLMTVFIAVLALHVVVIGGFTVYHLMSGGNSDTDITLTDKNHKDGALADGSLSGATTADKSTPDASTASTTPSATTATPDPTTPTSEAASTASPAATAPATTPSPAATPTPGTPSTTPAPINTPSTAVASTASAAPTSATPSTVVPTDASAATPAPVPALTLQASTQPSLAPPPDPGTTAETPSGPMAPAILAPAQTAPQFGAPAVTMNTPLTGPVHMPQPMAPSAPRFAHEREHEHFTIYTVKITDSYRKIAHAHHITVAELKEANHIHNNILHTGQKLMIPTNGTMVATTVADANVEPTPTRTVMNETVTTDTSSLASEPVGAVATTPAPLHHHLYTIKRGDTLVKIARKFRTTPLAIMEANDIPDPARLQIGRKLHIPSHEMRTARIANPVAQPAAPLPPAPIPVAPIQQAPIQSTSVQPVHDQPTEGVTPSSGEYANFAP